MNDELDHLLTVLRLKKIREIIDRELVRMQEHPTSPAEFLAKLLRAEHEDRRQRATEGRVKRAKIPEIWSLETFPWDRQPGINRHQIRQLAELEFIPTGTNLVFIGNAGTGKTGIASGILLRALHNGYRGFFVRAQDLFDEMYASLADRSSRRLLNRLINYDILLIDELGYLNLRPEQTNIFFKLMEERYVTRRATVITTNLEYTEWARFLNNRPLTEALLSRIRHRCITINIEGPSLRVPSEEQ